MKVYQIEDEIIAYFDGELSDADSAELMHRVSISPEIRAIFQQHEALHNMAARASRNVTVSPAVEDAVFANIAFLQDQEKRKKAAGGFWSFKRGVVIGAAAALLAVGLAESYEPSSVPFHSSSIASASLAVSSSADVANANFNNITPGGTTHVARITSIRNQGATQADGVASSAPEPADVAIAMNPAPVALPSEHITPPGIIGHGIPHYDYSVSEDVSRWEVGVESGSQSTTPADEPTPGLFTDFGFHASYALSTNDLAGIRFENGPMAHLNVTTSGDATVAQINSRVALQTAQAYELFYARRQPIDGGRFWLEADLAAGLLSDNGNLLSVGLGAKIPIGEHFLAGATFSLVRMHQNGPTMNDLIQSQTAPLVITNGSDVHNTLLERIEYGLSYRF